MGEGAPVPDPRHGVTILAVSADPGAGGHPTRLRRRPGLLAVAVGVPLAELVVLWSIGVRGDRVLVPQVTAPSPIAEYHDLRWLMLLQTSWLTLAVESAAALVLRILINAALVHQARSEEHTSELQSHSDLVCRLLLEK